MMRKIINMIPCSTEILHIEAFATAADFRWVVRQNVIHRRFDFKIVKNDNEKVLFICKA